MIIDSEAELMVVSSILIDPKNLDDAINRVSPKDFATPLYKDAFEVFIELDRLRKPIDTYGFFHLMEKRGHPTDISAQVVTGNGFNTRYYCKLVKERAAARSIAQATDRAQIQIKEGIDIKIVAEQLGNTLSQALGEDVEHEMEALELHEKTQKWIGEVLEGKISGIGLPYGHNKFDDAIGLRNGELTIIAARPGVGKTAFALQTRNILSSYGHCTGFISMEMSNNQLHLRTISNVAKIPLGAIIRGNLTQEARDRLNTLRNEFRTWKALHTDQPILTVQKIRSIAKRWKRQRGLDILFVDYLQLMESSGESKGKRHEAVSEMSRGLKLLAKELKIPVVAMCQLNRESASGDSRPGLHQLRESGSIEQDADNVILLHDVTKAEAGKVADMSAYEVIIAKQRSGTTGIFNFAFLRPVQTFEETN